MSSLRETSQQDRRVYVGNLSYDVKWHHLKDFMRQGTLDEAVDMRTRVLHAVASVFFFFTFHCAEPILTY